jgi:myo-inositol-1(or 4)-monophosphatase
MVGSDELLGLAREAGVMAARLLAVDRAQALATISTKSTSTDMVSELDRASEALIRDHLLGARPQDGFLGEEGGGQHGTSGIRWVVDPLDGTTNYLYDHPGWNVSIAAEDERGALVAVVVDPVLGDTFTAVRGGGAERNGEPIRCRATPDLATALVGTGFAYDPERRVAQAAVVQAVIGQIRDIRRIGAAAIDLCSVACGRLDAYWERGLGPWDRAAGGLVAQEAGATVLVDEDTGLVLAASPTIFDAFRAILVDAGADSA